MTSLAGVAQNHPFARQYNSRRFQFRIDVLALFNP
jgi:hypothetical protein